MNRFYLILCGVILICTFVYSQNNSVSVHKYETAIRVKNKDSVFAFFKKHPASILFLRINDSTKCKLLNKLIEEENEDSVWAKYNEWLLNLCEKKLKSNALDTDSLFFKKYLAKAYYNKGDFYAEKNENLSLLFYQKSLKIKEQIKDTSDIFYLFDDISSIYKRKGFEKIVQYYYNKALLLAKKYRNEKFINFYLTCSANLQFTLGNSQEALRLNNLVLNRATKNKDTSNIITAQGNISQILSYTGNINTALSLSLKNLELAKTKNEQSSIANILNTTGYMYYQLGKTELALINLKQSQKLYQDLGDINGSAVCLNNIAEIIYKNKNSTQEAISYYNKAVKLFESLKKEGELAICLSNLSTIYGGIGNTKKAIELAKKSILLQQKMNDYNRLGISYNNLGRLYEDLGNVRGALKYYYTCLKMAEKLNNQILISSIYNSIGGINYKQKEYETAAMYFNKSLNIAKESKYKEGECNALIYIGSVKEVNKDTIEALKLYIRSLKIAQEITYTDAMATANSKIGGIYVKKQLLDSVKYYFDKAYQLAVECNNKKTQETCLFQFTTFYKNQKQLDKALFYGKQHLDLAKELGYPDGILNASKTLKDIYTKTGDTKNALLMYEQYITMKDSIYNEQNRKDIIKKQLESDFDKKALILKTNAIQKELIYTNEIQRQKTISFAIAGFLIVVLGSGSVILYQRNKQKKLALQLKDKNEQLQKLNDSKTKLFSIIGHDIKSPMASVLSYTELLSHKEMMFTNEEIKTFAGDMTSAIRNLNGMLDTLLLWALNESNQLKPQFVSCNVHSVLTSTIELLQPSAKRKNIELNYTATSDAIVESDKNMLSVVFRNILSNAIKFSHNNSKVDIAISLIDNEYHISFKDYGVGMNEEQLKQLIHQHQLNSTTGTKNEKGNGLGLLLCYEFMQKLNGSLSVTSEHAKDTTVYVIINSS